MHVSQQSPDAPSVRSRSRFPFGDPCQPESTDTSARPAPGLAPFQLSEGCAGLAGNVPGATGSRQGEQEKNDQAHAWSETTHGGLKGGQSSELSTGYKGPEVGSSKSGSSLSRARAGAPGTRSPDTKAWGRRWGRPGPAESLLLWAGRASPNLPGTASPRPRPPAPQVVTDGAERGRARKPREAPASPGTERCLRARRLFPPKTRAGEEKRGSELEVRLPCAPPGHLCLQRGRERGPRCPRAATAPAPGSAPRSRERGRGPCRVRPVPLRGGGGAQATQRPPTPRIAS